jgi:hypothetical protein
LLLALLAAIVVRCSRKSKGPETDLGHESQTRRLADLCLQPSREMQNSDSKRGHRAIELLHSTLEGRKA